MAGKSAEPVGTELVTFAPDNPIAVVQSSEKFDTLLGQIREVVRNHKPDLATQKGRDAIAALAYKVARTKTALDDAGKKLNEDARKQIDAVDEQRRRIRTELDALRDEARKPLDLWEVAEAVRKETIDAVLGVIDASTSFPETYTAAEISERIVGLEATEFDAEIFQEWLQIAIAKKTKALETLRGVYTRTLKAEADAAELETLRKQNAEREAREAEQKAAREAEEQRQREAKEAEERAAREAEQAAAAERAAEEKRLADAKEAARLETERLAEAASQAAAEKQRELQAEIDAANAEAQRLREADEARQAEEKRIADEQAAREKDRAHRSAVMKAAKEALMAHTGIAEEAAKKAVLAIVAGEIPNVTLTF